MPVIVGLLVTGAAGALAYRTGSSYSSGKSLDNPSSSSASGNALDNPGSSSASGESAAYKQCLENIKDDRTLGRANWSKSYRDSLAANLCQMEGFTGAADIAGAAMEAHNVGIAPQGTGTEAGTPFANFMKAAGALSVMSGGTQSGEEAAQDLSKIRTPQVHNAIYTQLGNVVSPGGQLTDPMVIFKQAAKAIFGTERPTERQVLAARQPGSGVWDRVGTMFGWEPGVINQFLLALDNAASAGLSIGSLTP